jgi:hypothetical protein
MAGVPVPALDRRLCSPVTATRGALAVRLRLTSLLANVTARLRTAGGGGLGGFWDVDARRAGGGRAGGDFFFDKAARSPVCMPRSMLAIASSIVILPSFTCDMMAILSSLD